MESASENAQRKIEEGGLEGRLGERSVGKMNGLGGHLHSWRLKVKGKAPTVCPGKQLISS